MERSKQTCYSLAVIALVFLLSGCWTRPAFDSAGGEIEEPSRLSLRRPEQVMPEYRFGFGDVLDIRFFRYSEFDISVTVRPDGRISLPKVGELSVTGMTPAWLDSIITDAYAEFIRELDVTVIVSQFSGYQVYVLGEVNKPGGYAIVRNMTILHAMASAGGPKNTAKMGSVMIIRRDRAQGVRAFKVDIGRSLKAKQSIDLVRNDISVQPQDIIYVPKTALASVSDFMRQVYAGILPPLDIYLRALIIDNNL